MKFFQGNFLGNSNKIKNIYIQGEYTYGNGLFGRCKNSTIKDLTVSGIVTGDGSNSCGGISATMSKSNIYNCTSLVNISSINIARVGGIAGNGLSSNFYNCEFKGTIDSKKASNVGGIVGDGSWATIKGCINKGNLRLVNDEEKTEGRFQAITELSGIVGNGRYTNIESCINYGNLSSTNVLYVGGIIGEFYDDKYGDSKIISCCNEGQINCNGNILYVGGVAANLTYDILDKCFNNGSIRVDNTEANDLLCIGGILGCSNTETIVCNSYNTAEITAQINGILAIGGIVGNQNKGAVICCYNKGEIKGTSQNTIYIGGAIGNISTGKSIGLYNTGRITVLDGNTGTVRLGGIIGICKDLPTANNTYNFGKIVVPTNSSNIGGTIGGRTNTTVTDFYYENGVYSGTLYDAGFAQGADKIDKTAMVSRINIAANAFNTENAETLGVSAGTWIIDETKNDGYPILDWQ